MDADLKQYLEAMERRLNEQFNGLASRFKADLVESDNASKRVSLRRCVTCEPSCFAAASEG